MEVEEILKVINKIQTLAAETTNQPIIARRGVLPNIATFLKNKNTEVQLKSAETLKLLSSHPENQKLISNEPGLVDNLIKLFNDKTITNKEVKNAISEIFVNIADHLTDEQKESTLSLKSLLESLKKEVRDKKRNLTFSIMKLNNHTELAIFKVIMHVKGVISYSASLTAKELYVYTMTTAKYILSTLENAGYSAFVVSDEICSSEFEGQENKPPSQQQQQQQSQQQSLFSNSKAVVCETLQDRIEKRKKQKQTTTTSNGEESNFFSRITSVFW